MEKYVITTNLQFPNGITPIACKQAHGAVVLCKHNPTDMKIIELLFYNLSPFIIPYKRLTPLKPL